MSRDIFEQIDSTLYPGLGLGQTLRNPLDEAFDCDVEDAYPLAVRGAAIRPDMTTPETVGGQPALLRIRNGLRPSGAPQDMLARNLTLTTPASYAAVGAFANGAPCFDYPTAIAAQPYVPGVALNPNAHSLFGVTRISGTSQRVIIGYPGASFSGRGVYLIKVSGTNKIRLTYDSTLPALETTGTYLNKTFAYIVTRSAANGVRLYIDGALAGSDSTATAPATATAFQYFANGTGTGTQEGKFGGQWLIQDDVSSNASFRLKMSTYFPARHPIGA